MSGLEGVLAVGAILSGFASGLSLYGLWHSKRQNKADTVDDLKSDQFLAQAELLVEKNHDPTFSGPGEKVALQDDAPVDTARTELIPHPVTSIQSVTAPQNDTMVWNDKQAQSVELVTASSNVPGGARQSFNDLWQEIIHTVVDGAITFGKLSTILNLFHLPDPIPTSQTGSTRSSFFLPFICPGAAQTILVRPDPDRELLVGSCSYAGCRFRMDISTTRRHWIQKKAPDRPFGECFYFLLTPSYFHRTHLLRGNPDGKERFLCLLCIKSGKTSLGTFCDQYSYRNHLHEAHTVHEYKDAGDDIVQKTAGDYERWLREE